MYLVMRLGLVLRLSTFACALACAVVLAAPAGASQLIARNASNITLQVNSKGKALITYKAGRRVTHLLAWGAINARPRPATPSGPRQVKLKLDGRGMPSPWLVLEIGLSRTLLALFPLVRPLSPLAGPPRCLRKERVRQARGVAA